MPILDGPKLFRSGRVGIGLYQGADGLCRPAVRTVEDCLELLGLPQDLIVCLHDWSTRPDRAETQKQEATTSVWLRAGAVRVSPRPGSRLLVQCTGARASCSSLLSEKQDWKNW